MKLSDHTDDNLNNSTHMSFCFITTTYTQSTVDLTLGKTKTKESILQNAAGWCVWAGMSLSATVWLTDV